MNTQSVEMQTGNFFVKLFWKHVNAQRVLLRLAEKFNLRQNLVAKRVAHNKRRVTGCVTEVHQHRATVWQTPFVHLWLDFDLLDALDARNSSHVDLVVEVANVGNDG